MNKGGVLELGRKRLNSFQWGLNNYAGVTPATSARILDYGCGAGGFVAAALKKGYDAWGVDVSEFRRAQFGRLTDHNPRWAKRLLIYDGYMLPFESNSFDYVYSWYVLEHLRDLWQGLREIVRMLKPGGVAALFSEDGRNAIDSHAHIPWPPFMPRKFFREYLEEWGKENMTEYLRDEVFYVTQPQVVSLLEFFDMEILYKTDLTHNAYKESLYIRTAEDARAAARELKARLTDGRWAEPSS